MMTRKIRVLFADPDATDSSSDEESQKPDKKATETKQKVHEIVLQKAKKASFRYNTEAKQMKSRRSRSVSRSSSFSTAAKTCKSGYLSKKRKADIREKQLELSHESPCPIAGNKGAMTASADTNTLETQNKKENAMAYVNTETWYCADGRLVSGLCIREVNFGAEYFLPIIDNHGFLLGEFSRVDDLSIREFEADINRSFSLGFRSNI